MTPASLLLRRNLSAGRLLAFTLSSFIGLAIIMAGIMLYCDLRPLLEGDDSVISQDYLVINRRVSAANTLGEKSAFSASEIAELEQQPWVRSAAPFTAADYNVSASLEHGGRGMSTAMFFESIPDDYLDTSAYSMLYTPGSDDVPIIISKDYLTLYNFGFASAAGLPQLSEGLMSSLPLTLRLTSRDGTRSRIMRGRIAGYSNRLNTILVPESFMKWSNAELGSSEEQEPQRLIINVSKPGDPSIQPFLESRGW